MIEEQIYLNYGDKVALKSLINQQYVSVNLNDGTAFAQGHHPVLYVKDIDITKSEELIIYKFDDRESTEPVMFG